MSDPAPYRQPVASVLAGLGVDPEAGLSRAEARRRLQQYGPNRLEEEPPVPAWRRFLAEFQDVLVVLLLVAAAFSTGLWLWERDGALPYEAMAILAVVLLNATMGFIQESRAEQAVRALREMSADRAAVIRDGERQSVPSSDLVPGDVVLIEEGDTIPADARLVTSAALQTAEAALTGESLPVSKEPGTLDREAPLGDRVNMLFSGTTATYGHGRAVVTATGMATELGHIAGLLQRAPDTGTPLQRNLDRVGKVLGGIVVAIAVVMIATILALGNVSTLEDLADVLILGVALAVAAVPEGLPAVVTLVLSLGVQRMARRNVIVRRLAAVETLGSASVIASDKTGTLTRNEMTVRAVVTAGGRTRFGGSGYAPEGEVTRDDGQPIEGTLRTELERALAAADRANNAGIAEEGGRWVVRGDPTEGALLVAARKAGLRAEELDARHPRVAEIPFSSERKLMTTVHHDTAQAGRAIVFTKGAPDVLLPRCTAEVAGGGVRPLTDDRRREILAANESLADEALRTLGVAAQFIPREAVAGRDGSLEGLERELVFAGLIGMIDPPRDEARDAVALARSAGIRPIMITGDHPRTAAVIARELGIADDQPAVTGAELDGMSDGQLAEAVRHRSVYARVNPGHKIRLVAGLQGHGATVAMTGDGVNDAPALRQADIGIAMGVTGTDVSKEAADVILVDDNFASIVAAVEEGRAVFTNIRKFLRYLLSSNIGEVLTMFAGVLLAGTLGLEVQGGTLVLPLVATQILWINLVTDGPPALALGVDRADPGLMRLLPRPPDEPVVTGRMWGGIAFVGLAMAASTLLVLDASLPGGLIAGHGTLQYGQTMAFTTLMCGQLFNVFNARSEEESAFAGLFTSPWLWGAVALSLLLHAAVLYLAPLQRAFGTVPLSGADWIRCAAAASAVLWLRELGKLAVRLGRR